MILALATAWGFAEATVFFIVPDVFVSAVALVSPRRALLAAVAAALGAAAGGAVMFWLAASDPATAQKMLLAVPAIGPRMVADAGAAFAAEGVPAMLAGAWSGVPYKIFAVAAGEQGWPLGPFLLATCAVRLPRFVFAALAATVASRLVGGSLGRRAALLAAFWAAFYALYFATVGG